MQRSDMLSRALHVMMIAGGVSYSSLPAGAVDTCYRVVNVDFWDVLYLRTRPDHRSPTAGAIAPDHNGILVARGPCKPAGASRKRQWCAVEYFPLPEIRLTGYVKAYFVGPAACPKNR